LFALQQGAVYVYKIASLLGTVENHGKNGKKHGTLLSKSQKSRKFI